MHGWFGATLTCVALSLPWDVYAVQIPPAPDNPMRAQTALGFNLDRRCPNLRIADGGNIAVVVFWLPSSGIPSHISLKSSSGSNALDTATISCVSGLRFAAATTLGSGDPIDSWQQFALSWTSQAAEAMAEAAASTASAATTATTSAGMGANAKQNDSGGHVNRVTVHVCVDEAGKLKQPPTITQSSGMASLDQAAVKIAASGSAYYRPDTAPNGAPASGCAQLAIKFDTQ